MLQVGNDDVILIVREENECPWILYRHSKKGTDTARRLRQELNHDESGALRK